ncbi:MAG: 3-hydroxyacyl-CoA dehydrogenase [Candidatus Hydrogenedentes bacterium]|nr:3-hydroxyacyl-CoA dehydrogenase [Candidatus Hydrogenedentota bacterium]
MKLDGTTFIITGGASGLGAGTACEFVEGGANVVLADLNGEAAQPLLAELGKKAIFSKCDVCSTEDVQRAIELAVSTFGGLNGAINCAGIAAPIKVLGKTGPHDLEAFRKVIEINLIGTFNVIRLVAARMVELPADAQGERGAFINTASVAAFEGQIGQAAYSASKNGVVGMALPIARELARSGIRVNTIAPGLFDTPMLQALPEDVKTSLAQQVPFPSRFGTPREFGQLARHIVENAMINGECIRLDGAIRMQPK